MSYSHYDRRALIDVCPACGWWIARTRLVTARIGDGGFAYSAGMAVLKELNLGDVNAPVDEVRKYLVARYDRRFDVHPRLFEETVASVFRDGGYDVVVTGYSNDGGVDIILTGPEGEIGVQVKRYRARIVVEQIRALVGALVLRGLTKGIFVTTSDFQRGGPTAARQAQKQGFAIELLNASTFYDTLRLAQRPMYAGKDDFLAAHDLRWLPDHTRGFEEDFWREWTAAQGG